MKKIILIMAIITLSFTSCRKEDLCSQTNCGVIVDDGITAGCNWLDIRNDCSGNVKRFCFDTNTWFNNYVGDDFCVTNEIGW
tara:strand:- start:272 stop:517 length:246 start_codon:yes stop_codon:yes gene_type:complete